MYYFSYSYFMNHHELFAVCPGATFAGPGELSGYMLMFDGYSPVRKGAIANIESSREDEVWGGLYEITQDHLDALDRQIGYPRYSKRSLMKVRSKDLGEKVEAWVYYHEPHAEGIPSHEYIRALLDGARDCRIPQIYVDDWIGPYVRISEKTPSPKPKDGDVGFKDY